MAAQILFISFKLGASRADYEKAAASLAGEFATVPGLRWKIWTISADASEAGGVYLFESESSLQTFLKSPLVAQVKSHPAVSELTAKPYEVMRDATATTRGPVA